MRRHRMAPPAEAPAIGRSASGPALAVLSALSFGGAIPFIERAGRGVAALWTAALLSLGACLSALVLSRFARTAGAPFRREHLVRLFAMAILGAGIGSTLLAWGLQRTGGTAGSLLLNLEAVFAVLLGAVLYREPIGRRTGVAAAAVVLGGVALTLDATASSTWSTVGALAISGATAAWALDSALMRGLAERDPVAVVAGKGALGAAISAAAALVAREPWPAMAKVLPLVLCGAVGYGLSLRLYVLAQRQMGAARTATIFGMAPFVGAILAWTLGDRSAGVWTAISAALLAAGAFLLVTERHAHRHTHLALEHDHPHRHDDGHHDHLHHPPVAGEHSHPHRHDPLEHEHPHGPDIHHLHAHR